MSGKTVFLLNLVMSLKFFHKGYETTDKFEICSGQILRAQLLLEQMESGSRL